MCQRNVILLWYFINNDLRSYLQDRIFVSPLRWLLLFDKCERLHDKLMYTFCHVTFLGSDKRWPPRKWSILLSTTVTKYSRSILWTNYSSAKWSQLYFMFEENRYSFNVSPFGKCEKVSRTFCANCAMFHFKNYFYCFLKDGRKPLNV